MLNIKVGDQTLLAVWEENPSAEAFRELLSQGPLTVEMEDYGGFEKVGDLGTTLPRNDTQITTQAWGRVLYMAINYHLLRYEHLEFYQACQDCRSR